MVEFFYLLLGSAFFGYFALAGYDYGVGMLLCSVARTDDERRMTLGALGPFFLGNEVWLVAAAGLYIGAFPLAEGELFTALAPIAIPLLAAIVIFTAAVQLRSRAERTRRLWDWIVSISALSVASGWGAALGAMLQGFPLHFGPLPFVTAGATCALFALHGANLLRLRAPIEVAERAQSAARRLAFTAAALSAVAAVTAAGFGDGVVRPLPAILGVAAVIGAAIAAGRLQAAGRPGWAFVGSGFAAALPIAIVGLAQAPYLFVHSDASQSISMAEAAAGEVSLQFLSIAAVPVLPALLGFQAATWWIWRRAPRRAVFY